jgi:photosystem II stability/assembly factor-like uncharacterized protein
MKSVTVALWLVVALCACQAQMGAAKQWSVVAPSLASMLMGVSFTDAQTGYVAGGSSGAGALLLQTTNSGANWTNRADSGVMFMSVASESAEVRAASGLSMLDGRVDHHTQDGVTWAPSQQQLMFTSSMDSESLGDGVFHFYGQFTAVGAHANGMAVSVNGGQNATLVSYGADTSARYGSFVSPQVGFVAGGQWPETTFYKQTRSMTSRFLSKHLLQDERGVSAVHALPAEEREVAQASRAVDPAVELWKTVIRKTTDGGRTWSTLVNLTSAAGLGGYYPNGLSFVDEQNGWSAQEGNAASGEMHARIQHTSDGGQTWDTQYSCVDCSLFRVSMINALNGFAVGGLKASFGFNPLILATEDGGQTWTVTSGALSNLYVNDISILANGDAYATAFTPFQTSSVMAYN